MCEHYPTRHDDTARTPRQSNVRVGLVHVIVPEDYAAWPYLGFDFSSRQAEIEEDLARGCSGIEFVPLTVVGHPEDEIARVRALADTVDALLVFVLATNWPLTAELLPAIGSWRMPTVFVDEPYAGSGVFLVHGAQTLRKSGEVLMVSSLKFQDVVDVVNCFRVLGDPGASLERFLEEAGNVRSGNICRACDSACKDDELEIRSVEDVIESLKNSKILRVLGEPSEPFEALGATVETVTFDEINAAYLEVDREEARRWADRWIEEAAEVVEPSRQDIEDSAAIYLAMRRLLEEHGARAITVDCLGGFYSGKLPGYPCLGYRQLNDDGQLMGTCEARIPDVLSMMICRDMFNRNSFASDPVLDTSSNQIVYAHCVAPTRMLGPDSEPNAFRIRSHAEDGLGASIQSIMPEGYMTTSIGWDDDLETIVLHRARAVDNVDEERACRTKLAAEVEGDIDKLFREWDRFNWHRVTVYGDVQEPLEAVARALDVKIVHEA